MLAFIHLKKDSSTVLVKRISTLLLALMLFVVFNRLIAVILSSTLVEHVFSYIQSALYNDVIFIGIGITSIVFFIFKSGKYTPAPATIYILIFCAIIYLYYRLTALPWAFTAFSIFDKVKYADLLFLITAVFFLLHVRQKKPVALVKGQDSFFEDSPIGATDLDELGYTHYTTLLAEKIKNSSFTKAFAIGINGKWGAGKTSFIDLIKRQLDADDLISIDFNPWNSHTPTAIIRDFFDTVREAIQPYDSMLSSLLVKYANKLVELNDTAVTKYIQLTVATLSGGDSLSSLFIDINKSLKNNNKKLLIYIDDLDRLDKEEIVEVIRLIRNTANFHNTFFIVAYSKNYIAEALKDHNPYNHLQFLEKIFQIELTLPYFNKEVLRKKLGEKLQEAFPKEHHAQLNELINGTTMVAPIYLSEWIDTIRDVTRLANAISLNLRSLIGEVDINDFIRIEILRLKYPSVYELLYKKKHLFFKTGNSNDDKETRYQLIRGMDSLETVKEVDKNEYYLKLYLIEHAQTLGIDTHEPEKIAKFIQGIFSDSNSYSYILNHNLLSIVYAGKFDRYFSYSLSQDDLSEIEFNQARKLNSTEFNKHIIEWIHKGLADELKQRLMNVKLFTDRIDFEKIISAIFQLANYPTDNNSFPFIVGYDANDLYDKLNDYDGKIANTLYREAGGQQGLKKFIQSLFDKAVHPFYFEANFVKFIADRLFDNNMFPLQKDELKKISLRYLKEFCDKAQKLDRMAFFLYNYTTSTNYTETGGGTYQSNKAIPQEAKTILIDYVGKFLDDYLLWVIKIEPFKQKSFSVEDTVPELFNTWEDFQLFIDGQDENKWKNLPEFKTFLKKASSNNFSNYVAFEFNTIPISERIQNNL